MKKLILLACLFATPLYAGLFEDTEARKKLQEMQLKETELEARIVSLEAVIKSGSLNDMLNQIELIKQDVSKLRGDIETLRHLNATVEQRQKDLYQDLDGRLRKIALLPDSKYVLANTKFNLKNYKASIGTYQKLLDQHPEFAKNPEALLDLANAQIQLALIPEAKKSLKDLIKKYPQSDLIKNAQKRLKVLESIKP